MQESEKIFLDTELVPIEIKKVKSETPKPPEQYY